MGATKDINSKSPLLGLPNELLLDVASHLKSFKDLNSLARTSRFFHTMFNTDLYRRAVAADGIVLDKIVERVLSRYRLTSLTLLLDNGLSVNHSGPFARNRYEDTMLRFLCGLDNQEGPVPLARLLIQRGADMEAKSRLEETALYCAIFYRNCPIAALLLAHGAEPNVVNYVGETPLLGACDRVWGQAEMIHLLIEHGADIEARSASGDTPLIRSSQYSLRSSQYSPRVMTALLEHGADAGVHNNRGETPLHCASKWLMSEHHELAKSLLEHGADVNATDQAGRGALHWLLERRTGDPLFMAKFLLENGADVNAMSDEGSPLHIACRDMRGPAMSTRPQYVPRSNLECMYHVVELLLEHGAIVDATDASRVTPLYMLLFSFPYDEFAIADLLLKNGADVNAVSDEGLSILQIAIETERCADVIELLLLHGADVSVLSAAERCRMSQLSEYM